MDKMTRKEFLKKAGIGALFFGVFGKSAVADAAFSPVSASDNLSSKIVTGATAPVNTTDYWIDTSIGGVLKYWDGSKWDYCKSVWGP